MVTGINVYTVAIIIATTLQFFVYSYCYSTFCVCCVWLAGHGAELPEVQSVQVVLDIPPGGHVLCLFCSLAEGNAGRISAVGHSW